MPRTDESLNALEQRLAAQDWPSAAAYVGVLARNPARRAVGLRLRELVGVLPLEVRQQEPWPEALLWVAYRAASPELLQEVLCGQTDPDAFPAFRAFAASLRGEWAEALTWAEQALAQPQPAQHDLAQPGPPSPDRVLALRYRAAALARLGAADWHAAFLEARAATQPVRDRGLLLLEFAHHLTSAGRELEARDVLAQAAPCLRQDDWALALALSNLGITCLRLGDQAGAERALQRAVQVAERPEGRDFLSTVWRGLGGVYLWSGQWARAGHAYALAERKALNREQTVLARRSLAELLHLQGQPDEALAVLHSALLHAGVPDGAAHPVNADLAEVHVRRGDWAGARNRLALAQPVAVTDQWRIQVVQAELARQAGEADFQRHLAGIGLGHLWARQKAWLFPEVFASVGLVVRRPAWAVTVNLDGPIRVQMGGLPLDLRPTSPEAALLALLVCSGGSVGSEKALDALHLPGSSERRRRQSLSKVAGRLRERLGWPGALACRHHLLTLSDEPQWHVSLPPPERADLFCEGCFDPWVVEYRSESLLGSISA